MTVDTKRLRKVAEHANAVGGDWLAVFRGAANPTAVLALLDEIERLRDAFDGRLNDMRILGGEIEHVRQQLSAMTAARDEACGLAQWWMDHNDRNYGEEIDSVACSEDRRKLAELRKVGS